MDKVALVTGGSRGIGKAICYELARRGYNVIINFNKSQKQAEEVKKEIEQLYNIKAVTIKADLSNEEEIYSLYNNCLKNFNKIDILVNNAGVCYDSELCDRTVGQIVETFKINAFAPLILSRLVGREMYKNKFGKIINISSNNAINSFYPTTIDYDMTKSAINTLTKDLAIEFAPYINVNAIAPGWIETEMNKDLTPDIMELEKEKILKKRIGKPEDVANLVGFLVSEEASYINGEVIVIDGGMF